MPVPQAADEAFAASAAFIEGEYLPVGELAETIGWPVEFATLPAAVLARAEEVFLTSTAGGVMPVARIDGRPVGDDRLGPVTQRIRELYWAAHEDPKYTTPVNYRAAAVETG